MSMKPLSCPSCGSPDLDPVTANRWRCEHCGTESILSSDRTRLVLVQWECPQCGFNNESGAAYCGQCGSSLTRTCPTCGNQIRSDLKFCNLCGANYEAVTAEQRRRDRADELRRLRETELAAKMSLLQKSRETALSKASWGAVLLAALAGCVAWFLIAFGLAAVINAVLSQVPYDLRISIPIFGGMALAAGVASIVALSVHSRAQRRIDRQTESEMGALTGYGATVLDGGRAQQCED